MMMYVTFCPYGMLERHRMQVMFAENGKDGLVVQNTHLILM